MFRRLLASSIAVAVFAWLAGCGQPIHQAARPPAASRPTVENSDPFAAIGINAASRPDRSARRVVKFFGSPTARPVAAAVYVVESAGGMLPVFDFVKAELLRSVREMSPQQEFAVFLFSDGQPEPFAIGGQAKLRPATPENWQALKEWIKRKNAGSGPGETDARPALKAAFEIAGRPPKVIYLLTNGVLPAETAAFVKELNKERKVPVYTLLLSGDDAWAERQLTKIAEENSGAFRRIDSASLGTDYGEQ